MRSRPEWIGLPDAGAVMREKVRWLATIGFTHFVTLSYRFGVSKRTMRGARTRFTRQIAVDTGRPVTVYEGVENRPGHTPHHHLLIQILAPFRAENASALWRKCHSCAGNVAWRDLEPGRPGVFEYVAGHAEYDFEVVRP